MKKTLSIAMLLAGLVIPSQGQTTPVNAAKPNLSGTWKLNLEKSNFGDMGGPASETDTLTQTGDDLKIAVVSDTNEGKLNYEYSFKTDGTDTPFPAGAMPADSQLKIVDSKGEWHGSVLVVTQKITFGDYALTTTATYTLSPDGKTLKKDMQAETENGNIDFISVYDKV